MSHGPLKLLLVGYGLAALVGMVCATAGASTFSVAAIVWLGGAAAVIGLALTPGLSGWFRASSGESYADRDIETSLVRWEVDRLNDDHVAFEAKPAPKSRRI